MCKHRAFLLLTSLPSCLLQRHSTKLLPWFQTKTAEKCWKMVYRLYARTPVVCDDCPEVRSHTSMCVENVGRWYAHTLVVCDDAQVCVLPGQLRYAQILWNPFAHRYAEYDVGMVYVSFLNLGDDCGRGGQGKFWLRASKAEKDLEQNSHAMLGTFMATGVVTASCFKILNSKFPQIGSQRIQ